MKMARFVDMLMCDVRFFYFWDFGRIIIYIVGVIDI